jgi:hypothetical protein
MGFLSKLNRKRKKVQKKILEPVTKTFAKISDKFIPNELRPAMPYLAGIGSLMLPPGMGPYMRALASGAINVGGQIAADESSTGDLSDINLLSTAIAGGLGYLGASDVTKGGASGQGIRDGIEKGVTGVDQFGDIPVSYTNNPGLMQGAENIGREGIASLSEMVQGGRQNLVDIGRNPGDLFSSANKFETARDAMSALGPTATLATGDVAYEAAIDARNAQEALDAEEQAEFDSTNKATGENRANLQMTMMRQAGIPEDTVEETLEMNDLSEYYVAPQTAAYGGMMGRNDYEFGGIIEALKNAESREMMTQNRAMGGMMGMGNDPTYHQVRDQSGPVNLQGMMGYNMGGSVLPQGMEMDYRQGGFIPMGSKERADDVPARVSKNEFVMTADAVRAAGGGSVNQGAKRMYDLMNNLEAKA